VGAELTDSFNVFSSVRALGHAISLVMIENVSPHSVHLKKVLSPAKLLSHL
jgi:hypothetical protein